MYLPTRRPTLFALVAGLLTSTGLCAADEHGLREHGAHLHGIARLTLAAEAHEVQIVLGSPMANIVGFEHSPMSEADRRAVAKAKAALEDAPHLFGFPLAAACRNIHTEIHSELFTPDPDAQAHGHGEHPAGGPQHDRIHAQHADLNAEYHFECAHPEKLDRLQMQLFEAFPATKHLEVEYVIGEKQGATELGHANPVLIF